MGHLGSITVVDEHVSDRQLTERFLEQARQLISFGDIANAAAFLLDARSGFVTGQVLYVCGGMTVGAQAL